MAAKTYKRVAVKYAKDITSGKQIAGREIIQACQRFLDDLERDDLKLNVKDPDFVIGIIEKLMVHNQGEDMQGNPLRDTPLLLQPWQIFCIYNLVGFVDKKTGIRRYKEALIMIPRKQGKTMFVAALAFALALLDRKSGSKIYIVAASLKQASVSFEDILYTMQYRGFLDEFRVRDNNAEHSIHANMGSDGSVDIEALASNPKKHDSLNSNIQIVDEMHAIQGAEYERFKESGKAYRNKLCIGITTAGDDENSFGYRHMEYGIKVVNGTVKDDSFFVFIARADKDENGEVDYTNPIQHQKASPSYGVTINPDELMQEALQAKHDPQKRKGFLSRSLNIYTTAMNAYFDIDEFRKSDAAFTWTLAELAKLPVDWYGGADLSKIKDLTAACLYGTYQGVDIVIPHAFFPVTRATEKAEEDDIPLYEWLDDGWLTMCNAPTIIIADVVAWFVEMRNRGFKIKQIGHDRKFAGEEYFPMMKKAHFSIVDQPQLYYLKSQGFRHIEKAASDGRLYYCHSTAYEYCLQNIRAWEATDDAITYEKISEHHRIDLFDASVFACIRMIKNQEKRKKARQWFGDDGDNEA